MRLRLAIVGAAVLALALLGSCSLGLDFGTKQCASDADCIALGGTTCDVAAGVCTGGGGGGAGGGSGGTGGGGTGGSGDPCLLADKGDPIEVSGSITSDFTFTCDHDWILQGQVFVEDGVTLSIEPGTTILGGVNPEAVFVVKPGGKLNAVGTKDRPIVFTSSLPPSLRMPGDWGGVIVLGRASSNFVDPMNGMPAQQKIEGVEPPVYFGGQAGTDDSDSSGTIKYVRIEYAGFEIAPNNEVNGLTFGGVGSGTIVDFVQVRYATDDCFEFFGGTVNAKHLVCWLNQDDMFDFDNGYRGKLQFLLGRSDPSVADDNNGFESDNDAITSQNTPFTSPLVFNATLLGKNVSVNFQQYGLLLRRNTHGTYRNVLVTGFEAGLDLRDAFTQVDITNSIFSGNLVFNLAYPEMSGGMNEFNDDDGGVDESAFLLDPARDNLETDPGLPDPFSMVTPLFRPTSMLSANAATPPSDGFFDATATYVGAFADETDDWATGNWVIF